MRGDARSSPVARARDGSAAELVPSAADAPRGITKDRKVSLKGQVRTERERMAIDSKARAADDVIDVDDQIELVR